MRHIKAVFLVTSLSAALVGAAVAQPVRVRLHVPPPTQTNIENLWWVDLNNTTQTTYTARLHGEVHELQQGLVYFANTDSFKIPPGTKRVTLRDVRVREQEAKPGYEAFIVRTGLLPEGDYTYVVRLEPDLGGDSGKSSVRNPSPPRLISPRDGDEILGQQPVFSWTRPGNFSGSAKYRLTIVEILPGQTRDEALRSNRPFFQQSNIGATQFRYPLSVRRLDWNKPLAWKIEAELPGGRGNRIASEARGFSLAIPKPKLTRINPLTMTRAVVRQGNGYSVTLNLRNNTGSEMTNVVIVDSSLGFQVLDRAAVYIKLEGGAQPYVLPGTFETGTNDYGSTSWIKVTKSDMTIPAGKTLFVGYTMMPLQYIHVMGPGFVAGIGCRATYKVGEQQEAKSFNTKAVEVADCAMAWKTADYLIVTNPIKLYQQNSGARTDVDKLLAAVARLAWAKNGVMLHFPASSATQLRSAIKLTGNLLASGWKNSGYLLLVGESEILPCWDTVWCTPDRPVPWSDHKYSDLDDDYYPELKVGRIIGITAAELTAPIGSSLAVHHGEGGAHYDGSRVLLVTGVEQPLKGDNFTADAGPGAQYLNTKSGVTAHYWGQEYFTTRANVIAKALTHTPVASGGAATDTLNWLLAHYTEAQLAAWLFAVNSPSSFNAQYPVKQTDTYFNDFMNRQRRMPTGFGQNGISQAVQQAQDIENARRGGWANQAYVYSASPQDMAGSVMRTNLPKQDALFFSAHGWHNNFNMLTTSVVNSCDFTSDKRRPVVVSYACWNGDYPYADGLARAYLVRGGGVFIGYTAMTSTGWFRSEVRDKKFLQYWAKSRKVGDVFWDWKSLLAQTANSDAGNLRMLFGHNLYGDPKFGGS